MKNEELYMNIQALLKVKGITNPELLEELSDHYITMYESSQTHLSDHNYNLNSVSQKIDNLNLNHFRMTNRKQSISTYVKLGTAAIFCLSFVFFATQSNKVNSEPPSIWPVQLNLQDINTGYGMMIHPIHETQKMHKGIDIVGNIGEPVYATSAGIISKSVNQETGYGNHIIVSHDKIYQTKYCHLSELLVSEGDQVNKGDIIGRIGTSGLSSAPHLHYEVLKNGENVDPNQYL